MWSVGRAGVVWAKSCPAVQRLFRPPLCPLFQMGVTNAELWANLGLCCFYSSQYDMCLGCLDQVGGRLPVTPGRLWLCTYLYIHACTSTPAGSAVGRRLLLG